MYIKSCLLGAALTVASVSGLVACQSPAYLNVPSLDGDVASNDANSVNARNLYIVGIRAAASAHPVQGQATILLPEQASWETYQAVLNALGEGFMSPEHAQADVPVYEVRSIAARSSSGEIKVLYPHPLREVALVEVPAYYNIGTGWKAHDYLIERAFAVTAGTHVAPEPPEEPEPEAEEVAQTTESAESRPELVTEK